MTKVLAAVVYQLNVDELPLKKLEMQQNKNQGRGRSRSNVTDFSSNNRDSTFSKGLLMKSVNVGKSHPMLHRTGSASSKRERYLSGGNTTAQTSHRSLNPMTKVTGEPQLGDVSTEPLLIDSMASLVSDSTRSLVDCQSSTLSQSQQQVDDDGRRSSEPNSTTNHPLLMHAFSAPAESSNTPSPLPSSYSPLGQKSPWRRSNESPVESSSILEQQSSSAFISPLPPNDSNFVLANELADTLVQPHNNQPSSSRRTSDNICSTPESKKPIIKAFSVDDARPTLTSDTSSSNMLSGPDSFSTDILPDRSGSVKVRRIQSNVIHEHYSEGTVAGDFCIRNKSHYIVFI